MTLKQLFIRLLAGLLLFSSVSCVSLSSLSPLNPLVSRAEGAGVGHFDGVYFTFGNDWIRHHTVTEVLQQEFERRGYAVLLEEPSETLKQRVMQLHLNFAGDRKFAGLGRSDHLRFLALRLERMSDGKELGAAHYDGFALDRIEQRMLVQQIVDELLKES